MEAEAVEIIELLRSVDTDVKVGRLVARNLSGLTETPLEMGPVQVVERSHYGASLTKVDDGPLSTHLIVDFCVEVDDADTGHVAGLVYVGDTQTMGGYFRQIEQRSGPMTSVEFENQVREAVNAAKEHLGEALEQFTAS